MIICEVHTVFCIHGYNNKLLHCIYYRDTHKKFGAPNVVDKYGYIIMQYNLTSLNEQLQSFAILIKQKKHTKYTSCHGIEQMNSVVV